MQLSISEALYIATLIAVSTHSMHRTLAIGVVTVGIMVEVSEVTVPTF